MDTSYLDFMSIFLGLNLEVCLPETIVILKFVIVIVICVSGSSVLLVKPGLVATL